MIRSNHLSRAIDSHADLKVWGPLAIKIGRRTAHLVYFRYREDWKQSVVEVALEAANSGIDPYGGKETVRLLGRLWRQKMRSYGFSYQYDVEGESIGTWHDPSRPMPVYESVSPGAVGLVRQERPRCGVSLCTASGVYRNEKYGRLCRRHEMLIRMRRKRGWSDPYEEIETAGIKVSDTYVPSDSKNKKFWAMLRLKMASDEWTQMWEWAKGIRKDINPAILARAHSIAVHPACGQ